MQPCPLDNVSQRDYMCYVVSSEDRKEKVLHTRIPAALEEQIKRLAEGLRVPVSNLVRNMLEDAILVTKRVRDHIPAPSGGPTRDASADIYGWQQLALNMDASCSRCRAQMSAGDQAYVGLSNHPRDAKVFLCQQCLPKRTGRMAREAPPQKRNGTYK